MEIPGSPAGKLTVTCERIAARSREIAKEEAVNRNRRETIVPLASAATAPVVTAGVFQSRAMAFNRGGARFMGLVHHIDAEREYAYDRQSHVGKLDKALDEANAKGWTVVDMKRDWRTIFPTRN
jgi:hypothetical protein